MRVEKTACSGRVADPKPIGRLALVAPLFHVIPRGNAERGFKGRYEKLERGLVDLEDLLCLVALLALFFLCNLYAVTFSEIPYRVGKTHAVVLRQKSYDVPSGMAAEAIKKTLILVHGERRRFLGMKRAKSDVIL